MQMPIMNSENRPTPGRRIGPGQWCALAILSAILSTGCSIKRMAVNAAGNALAGGGTTFTSDDDPELIKAALPFSLKLMESLLAESPRHQGLLFATTSGFTSYAVAFVQQDADEAEKENFEKAEAIKKRALRLFLRARNYGLRGLDVSHPGFQKKLRANPTAAVRVAKKADVPLLYWTAAAWAKAVSLSVDDPNLVGDLPMIEALINRALELDEAWNEGAIHGFLITYEMSRSLPEAEREARARKHFERAMALSQGRQAGPLVALAEAVSVPKHDATEFEALLNQALAIDPDQHPESRLINLVMQRRARWLLAQRDDLFLTNPK
jgi:tetratricopeptide (TPR) repeat protein